MAYSTRQYNTWQEGLVLIQSICIVINQCFITVLENLKHSRGNYTDEHVQRCGQLVGQVRKEVSIVMHADVDGVYEKQSPHKTGHHLKEDIHKFVRVYSRDKLFSCVPGRQHGSFERFAYGMGVTRPGHFKGTILRHMRVVENDFQVQEIHGLGKYLYLRYQYSIIYTYRNHMHATVCRQMQTN